MRTTFFLLHHPDLKDYFFEQIKNDKSQAKMIQEIIEGIYQDYDTINTGNAKILVPYYIKCLKKLEETNIHPNVKKFLSKEDYQKIQENFLENESTMTFFQKKPSYNKTKLAKAYYAFGLYEENINRSSFIEKMVQDSSFEEIVKQSELIHKKILIDTTNNYPYEIFPVNPEQLSPTMRNKLLQNPEIAYLTPNLQISLTESLKVYKYAIEKIFECENQDKNRYFSIGSHPIQHHPNIVKIYTTLHNLLKESQTTDITKNILTFIKDYPLTLTLKKENSLCASGKFITAPKRILNALKFYQPLYQEQCSPERQKDLLQRVQNIPNQISITSLLDTRTQIILKNICGEIKRSEQGSSNTLSQKKSNQELENTTMKNAVYKAIQREN